MLFSRSCYCLVRVLIVILVLLFPSHSCNCFVGNLYFRACLLPGLCGYFFRILAALLFVHFTLMLLSSFLFARVVASFTLSPLSFPRCNCVLAVAIVLLCSWYCHACQIFFSCSLCQKQLLYTPTLAYSVNVMSLSARCSGQCIGTSLLRSLAGGSWRLAGHGWLRTQQSRWEYVGLLPHLWRMYRCVLFLTPDSSKVKNTYEPPILTQAAPIVIMAMTGSPHRLHQLVELF